MELYFPHENTRTSQKELMEEIYTAIEKHSPILVQAPTGIGKTSSAISPALTYALKQKKSFKVIFVTPKHTQHKIAIETARAIKTKYNLDFAVTDLIGKKWMCAQSGSELLGSGEFGEYCHKLIEEDNCHYHSNVKSKQKISLETQNLINDLKKQILHVEEQKEISKKCNLCPYEIACLLAHESKLIIADYHHIFDPPIRTALFQKINIELEDCIIIVDEAHNLPDKAREMLSTETSTLAIEAAAKEAHYAGYREISEDITQLKNVIENISKQKLSLEKQESLIKKEEIVNELKKIIDYDEFLGNIELIAEETHKTSKRSFASALSVFLQMWRGSDDPFLRTIKRGYTSKGKPNVKIVYRCLDPSLIIKPVAETCQSFICMSGTLTPLEIYSDIFGIKSKNVEFPNPFPKHNKLNLVIPDTTTKFTMRDDKMYQKIADYCTLITNNIPGSSAIFFPSYSFRDKIASLMQKSQKTIFSEMQRMTKEEKARLLEKFKDYKESGAVLLAVAAGNFGEGLDFKDNLLKCVIVVGLPLSKPDLETQELINYYDKKYGKGWEYGYTLPALTKCLQNAGRCIRSETDKGIIVYLDERFTWTNYYKYFPKTDYIRITKDPLPLIKEFFEKKQ